MRQQINVFAKGIVILPLIWLCGCVSPKALRSDYGNYSEMYADSSNQQLLLNLARESHQDPVYFIQLASISSQYQFTTSVGITPSYVFRHTPASLGGSLSAGLTQNPVFQFLPLNGSNFVQAVLTPISDKVFYTFYDQDWPANWVLRTMVDSVKIETVVINSMQTNRVPNYNTNGIKEPVGTNTQPVIKYITKEIKGLVHTNDQEIEYSTKEIIEPVSTNTQEAIEYITTNTVKSYVQEVVTNFSTNVEVYVNDPTDPTYPKFLEFCDNLRNAQTYQTVTVDKDKSGAPTVYSSANPKLSDVVGAIQSGLSVKYDTNTDKIIATKPDETLKLVTNTNDSPYYHYFKPPMPTNMLEANMSFTNAQAFAIKFSREKVTFKTRTFETIMSAVASEGDTFQDYAKTNYTNNNISFTNDDYGPVAVVYTNEFKVRPILMINYNKYAVRTRSRLHKLIEVEYKNDMYTVGDFDGEEVYPNDFAQNRAVFTMISYLFSQTAIDTSKLPVQQLIQVQ
jgi:hypothetical protein